LISKAFLFLSFQLLIGSFFIFEYEQKEISRTYRRRH
jgi:hypothetical protein